MKSINKFSLPIITVFLLLNVSVFGQLDNILKQLTGNKSSDNSNLSTETVTAGLKEALEIGTGNAVNVLSITNGYFGNELVKIILPPEVKKIEPVLRNIGLGNEIDKFILTMNRAAESAASEAAPIFIDAIKSMNLEDAMKILNGGDNAATNYFKEKTTSKLASKFKPIISNSMNQVGVTKAYKDLTGGIANNPFIKIGNTDLDSYVTNKALDGLFTVVAQEEAKIRNNPDSQVTNLLKEVFGSGG